MTMNIYENACRYSGDQKKCEECRNVIGDILDKASPEIRLSSYSQLMQKHLINKDFVNARLFAEKICSLFTPDGQDILKENSFLHAQAEFGAFGVYADDETCASLALEHLEKYKKIISHPDFKGTPLIQEDMLEKAFAKLMKKSKKASS